MPSSKGWRPGEEARWTCCRWELPVAVRLHLFTYSYLPLQRMQRMRTSWRVTWMGTERLWKRWMRARRRIRMDSKQSSCSILQMGALQVRIASNSHYDQRGDASWQYEWIHSVISSWWSPFFPLELGVSVTLYSCPYLWQRAGNTWKVLWS